MIPFASTTSSQIRYLLQSLNDSNSDSVFQELCQLADLAYLTAVLQHMELREEYCCLETIFDYLSIYGKDLKNMQFDAVYSSIFKYILDKPNFSTVFLSEKIEVGLALSDSENADVKMCGTLMILNEDSEDDFDALLMEMEKEMSMADTMKELGYGCTANALQCKEILSLFLPLTEITVARILGMIVRTYSGLEDNQNNIFQHFELLLGVPLWYDLPSPSSWNGDDPFPHNKAVCGSIWKNSEGQLSFFLSHAVVAPPEDPFPLQAVCGSIWKNSEGQLSFLSHAVVAPPEAYVDAVNDHKFQHGHSNHAWLCLDLLEVLCQLAERGHANSVRSILEHPLKHCPELLLLGLSHINTVYNLLQHEISSTVFPMILKNAPGMGMIHYLWHVNPSILVRGFVDAITIDTDNISRVLEACQELKILSPVLDMLPSNLSIRLAAVASMKGLIDLEKWLNTNLSTYKDKFYEECLKFLKEVQFGAQDVSTNCFHPPNTLLNIYLEASSMFIKLLQSHTGLISSHYLSEELEKLNMTYMNSNSRLKTVGASNSSTSDAHADDIEAEVNSYFQQMFHEERSVESIIQMLTRFKESSDKREQAVFEFMIANLFEEYKFFSKYPDKQLTIAAVLFGSLIKCQLVTHLTLGIALRAVLDALRKPADSKMFSFGTKALDQFRERLIEWPQYCNHILQISHLRVNHLDIVLYIERALARISSAHSESDIGNNAVADPFPGIIQSSTSNVENSPFTLGGPMSSQSSGMQLTPPVQLPPRQQSTLDERKISTIPSHMKTLSSTSQTVGVPSSDASNIPKAWFGSALNIETLVAAAERRETPIEAPASEVQDKVSFIINNLAIQNVDTKAKEFAEILKEQYYPWFAQYMVMKRASIEQNFHDLYLKFLDKVNSKALYKEVVQATYENCKVLLGSELIKSSSEERSLLKNLGSWLGKITIGRNQVLRAREIDPKSLIIEAYEKGLMIAVIPFTSKILEPCQSSLAYQPPNPWTMGILGLLAEIYAMPNLKMNLKFDIEVLFKNLGVDLKDVAPTSLLKDRVREVEGNPDFSNKDAGSSQSQIVTDVKSGLVSTLNQVELPLEAATSSHPGSHSRILSQYASPLHLPSATLMEEEKLVALVDQHQIPSGQGIIPGQTPFSVSQLPTPTSNIEQQVIINPRLRALGMHVHFQSVLPIAMDRAIKEIVTSIVHRSVSIATQTTKELVLKDYAMESDETRIRNAAHLMVASLAGSLAHVTCKEPLRGSISSQLRSTLQGLSISSELLEQAVQLVTNDNLDLGCALIEQAATEKAIQTIDETIAQQLAIRKHREGPTFFDSGVYTPGHMGVLPEALRPKPGRLSHSQQRDFVRLPLQNQSGQSSNTLPVGPSPSPSSSGLSRAYVAGSGQMNPAIYSAGLVNAGISSVPQPLDIVSEEIDASSSQLHSASSPNNGMGDGGFENDTIAQLSSASTAELQPVEQSNVVKEPGLSVQPPNSTPTSERHGNSISEPLLTTGDALDKYQIISEKLENLVSTDAKEAEIQGIIAEVPAIILRCISRDEAALAVAQKVFKGLYENASNTVRVNAHLAILAAIRDVSKLVVKELTSWVTYSDEERKFNKDITVGLIRSELLNLAEYNVHMAKLIDAGRNKPATEFAISLIQTLLAARPGSPESLRQLVEIAKNPSVNASALSGFMSGKEDNMKQPKDKKASVLLQAGRDDTGSDSVEPDPAGFREQVSMLFAEWYRICELPGASESAYAHYVIQLHQSGLLKGDDASDRFFRLLMELSVSHCLSSEVISSGPSQSHLVPLSFLAIDIYAKLVYSVLKVLAVTVKFIQKDSEEKKISFNPRPYFRLFINWLLDFGSLEPVFDGANFQVLTALANAFHALQPLKVPGFSFAWLELVSHRSFMPKLLTAANAQKGWPYFQRLLVDLFQFMEPFLRNAELGEAVHFLYKGTLRVLLVLLHDYPEFLCDYHFSFCDVIPPSCIQMRNIILSAFPRNMRLPDPSTPNLKIDLLAEISQSPRILSEVDAALKTKQIKSDIDEYLKTRQQGSLFLSELKQKVLLSPTESARAGTRYNVPLINSLVLYVGMLAIQQLQARTAAHSQSMASSGVSYPVYLVGAALDIFQSFIMDLDTEGRYLFLNAVANQLRYPNNHTHYFSFILLYLFSESNQNPRYNFWSRSFTRCAPEIEKLFESVSRSCGGPKPVDDSVVSGGIPDNMH
nr:CCR4-NOT transcription complex subunit 1 isoform X1 [Ipomoea batatas]